MREIPLFWVPSVKWKNGNYNACWPKVTAGWEKKRREQGKRQVELVKERRCFEGLRWFVGKFTMHRLKEKEFRVSRNFSATLNKFGTGCWATVRTWINLLARKIWKHYFLVRFRQKICVVRTTLLSFWNTRLFLWKELFLIL